MYSIPFSVFALVTSLLLLAIYFAYRATFPSPIPGIPYVKSSLHRPFGDLQDALKYQTATKELISFLTLKCVELNSPIVQVFVKPFQRPIVVLADCHEAQDIMVRRFKEFDRSEFFRDVLEAAVPQNHVHFKSGEEWRSHRRLIADTMSTQFLHESAGPRAYAAFTQLVDLWRSKSRLAAAHPVDVNEDMNEVMVDAIWTIAFGNDTGATKAQRELLSNTKHLESLPSSNDEPASIPRTSTPTDCTAIQTIADSSEIASKTPFGHTVHYYALKLYPPWRSAVLHKNKMIRTELDNAQARFSRSTTKANDVKSAIDLLISREGILSAKERRPPQYYSATMQDELFGFLAAGYDTTASALKWALKLLTLHQDKQQTLRQHLRNAYTEAAAQGRAPTIEEIVATPVAYLDAVIEESLRIGRPIGINVRTAVVDTTVLGHRIPKGTDVYMATVGPSYTAESFPIDDGKRSESSQAHLGDVWNGSWDTKHLGDFQPERWLATNDKGEVYFNSRAGPMHMFGAGLRGCFGRKLAMLDMRIFHSLMIWHFEMLPLPEELGSMKGIDVLTHKPQQNYLRLATI